jgi:glycosyltransferase involved in cell wall biosynthesis
MANRYGMRHRPLRKQVSFRLFERKLLTNAAAVHVTSRGESMDFSELGVSARCVLIPLAVEPEPAGFAEAFLARYPCLRDCRIITFIGRINPIKNLRNLISALSVMTSDSDMRLVICGEGTREYVAILKAHARACGVADRVIWTGFLSDQPKADLLAATSAFAMPSLSESFGMAAIEALSAGLPCLIGKDMAIAADLVTAGFGVAVEPTADGISAGIRNAISLQSPTFGERAKAFVADTYSIRTLGSALSRMYASATGIPGNELPA